MIMSLGNYKLIKQDYILKVSNLRPLKEGGFRK